ncbi:MAG: peptidoglycan DD-metalloendopeptidase family protein, partial [Anaerolineae bacterium]
SWRLAAHGAVLVLTLGVFMATRYSLPGVVEASQPQNRAGGLAARVGRQARDFLPNPVLGTDESSADSAADDGSDAPGFISTGLVAEADQTLLPWDEPQRYVVKSGDTISLIALQFGIEAETILFANPDLRENPHSLQIGQEITILPVDGVLHVVGEGDTIESLAEEYEADAADIVAYTPNGLSEGDALVEGAEVVVPGGTMEIEIPAYYSQGPGYVGSPWASDGGRGPVAGTGSFYTASYGSISTWFSWWHPAVDIANSTGTPVYAVDSGTVEVAGWYGWAGQAIILDHGNGFESLYAHLSSINVAVGQTVQRGQIIGGIGCTYGYGGRCTGPHLHLELYYQGARVNPCSYGCCP